MAPAIVKRLIDVWWGRDPEGVAQSNALHLIAAGNLNGRDGTPHFGMKGEANMTFTGLVASPQNFIGAAQMGASPKVVVQKQPALPNADAPAALATFVDPFDGPGSLVP